MFNKYHAQLACGSLNCHLNQILGPKRGEEIKMFLMSPLINAWNVRSHTLVIPLQMMIIEDN